MPTPNLAPLVVIPLLGWSMYRRIRRQFGRQPLSPRPITARLVIFGILSALLIAFAVMLPGMLVPIAAGMTVGALIAAINLRLTRFEWTGEADYYYPHPYVGAALTLLFVGRVAYRFFTLQQLQGSGGHGSPAAMQSPLTFGILALLLGYYVAYAIGLLIVRARHHRQNPNV